MLDIEIKEFNVPDTLDSSSPENIDMLWLTGALAMSMHSTCVRRMYGIIIVKNGKVIGKGYNGNYDGCHRECTIEGSCLRDLNCVGDDAKFDPCLREELGINLTDKELEGSTFYIVCFDRHRGKYMDIGLSQECIIELNDCGVKRLIIGKKSGF